MSVLTRHCSEIDRHCGSLTRGNNKLHGCGSSPAGRNSTRVIGGTGLRGECRMVDGGARMGALRRAGVWLGLVEEDDERGYDQRGYRYGGGYADDFVDDEDDVEEVPATPRARMGAERVSERASERVADRVSDRV